MKHETKIINALKPYPDGKSTSELSKQLGTPRETIYNTCEEMRVNGKLNRYKERRGKGPKQNIYKIRKKGEIPNHILSNSSVDDVDEKITETKPYNGKPSPGYDVKAETVVNHLKYTQLWSELKNKLIKDGDCGTALKIMVDMEEEARL